MWTLGGDVTLDESLHCFYGPLKVPSISKLCSRTNESVKSVTQTYHAETGERLLKSDLNQKIEIGDQQLAFSLEEKKNFRIEMKPGITLLGFNSLNYLSPKYHMQKSAFIYPNKELVKGSTSLFTSLLDSCYEKRKFAMCDLLSQEKFNNDRKILNGLKRLVKLKWFYNDKENNTLEGLIFNDQTAYLESFVAMKDDESIAEKLWTEIGVAVDQNFQALESKCDITCSKNMNVFLLNNNLF